MSVVLRFGSDKLQLMYAVARVPDDSRKTYQDIGLIEFADEIGERAAVGEEPNADSQCRSSGDLKITQTISM